MKNIVNRAKAKLILEKNGYKVPGLPGRLGRRDLFKVVIEGEDLTDRQKDRWISMKKKLEENYKKIQDKELNIKQGLDFINNLTINPVGYHIVNIDPKKLSRLVKEVKKGGMTKIEVSTEIGALIEEATAKGATIERFRRFNS